MDGAYTCFISVPALVGRGENASGGIAVDATGDGSTARRVIELDGARAGPVDRGECTDLLEVRFRFPSHLRLLFSCILSYRNSDNAGRSTHSQRRLHQAK